jgi:hypothetical protein
VATRERLADLGLRRGRATLTRVLGEVDAARRDRDVTLGGLGAAVGLSEASVSRTRRGRTDDVGIVRLSQLSTLVGLELSARTYPAGQPLREAGQAAVLRSFLGQIHRSLRAATEVPLPIPGDQRAWDAMVLGNGWRYGVEVESHPTDGQALGRRLQLKLRDGGVDGMLLVLPSTRHVRLFLAAAGDLLAPIFPVDGRRALELLAAGVDPGGSAIIVL